MVGPRTKCRPAPAPGHSPPRVASRAPSMNPRLLLRPRAPATAPGSRFLHSRAAMRIPLLLSLLGLAACGRGPSVPIAPLPELVMPAAPAAPLAVRELLLVPQEKMIWDVHWRGLTIGRVELAVDGDEVHSRFRTGAVVSTVTAIDHELATVLDRARARAASQQD